MSGADIKCAITITRVYGGNLQKEHIDHDSVLWFIVTYGNIPKLACYDNEYFIDYIDPILVYSVGKTEIHFWQPNPPKKDEKTGQVTENKFMIFTKGSGTIEGIQRFINHCRTEYKNYKNNKLEDKLWYFEHCTNEWKQAKKAAGQEDFINKNYTVFTKKPFVSNKSFNNIFSDQATKIRETVTFFKNNKQWYVDKGMPYTLGYVFHGPPGSGKTSCNKAIAKELERHMINVRFGELTTNAQIDNLFNSQYIYVYDKENNEIEKFFVPITKRMVVVEDFDAMGDIILKRSSGIRKKSANTVETPSKPTDDLAQLDGLFNDNKGGEEKKDQNAIVVTAETTWEDWVGAESKKLAVKAKKGEKLEEPVDAKQDEKDKKDDKINLSTILNVLDGPCEVEGRVICFTTNYIDKLDPALVRPGRITDVVKFELISNELIYQMFCHFYDNSKCNFKKEPFARIKDRRVSPAYVTKVLLNNVGDPVKALNEIVEKSNKRKVTYF